MSIWILIPLRIEESDKMSADSVHIQGANGGESANSLAACSSYSLTIDAKYVFCFSNNITIFRYYIINDYLLMISSIMRILPNLTCFVCDVESISKLIVSCIFCKFFSFYWVWIGTNHASTTSFYDGTTT